MGAPQARDNAPEAGTAAETEQSSDEGTGDREDGKLQAEACGADPARRGPRLVIVRQPRKDNDPMGPIRDSEERKERSSRKAGELLHMSEEFNSSLILLGQASITPPLSNAVETSVLGSCRPCARLR